jgi:hypothetical protein
LQPTPDGTSLFPDPIFPIVEVPLDQSFNDQLEDLPDDREIPDNGVNAGPVDEENFFHDDGVEDGDKPHEAPVVARRKWRRRNVLIPLSKVKQKFKEAKAVRNL